MTINCYPVIEFFVNNEIIEDDIVHVVAYSLIPNAHACVISIAQLSNLQYAVRISATIELRPEAYEQGLGAIREYCKENPNRTAFRFDVDSGMLINDKTDEVIFLE